MSSSTSNKNHINILNILIEPENAFLKDMYESSPFKNPENDDSGLDLYLPEEVTLKANSFGNVVKMGIRCELVRQECKLISRSGDHIHTPFSVSDPQAPHTAAHQSIVKYKRSKSGYTVHPRSSLGKTPIRLSNSTGIIDCGYRGEIMVMLDNISSSDYTLHKGDRIVQICMANLKHFSFRCVSNFENPDTIRGEGGLGSTGK